MVHFVYLERGALFYDYSGASAAEDGVEGFEAGALFGLQSQLEHFAVVQRVGGDLVLIIFVTIEDAAPLAETRVRALLEIVTVHPQRQPKI